MNLSRGLASPFCLDEVALARGRASDVLAVAPGVFGTVMALAMTAPASSWDPAPSAPTVAVVEVFGPLAQHADTVCGFVDGYDAIEARFGAALADPDVGVVVMRIDSPGGDVAGMGEAVKRMRAAGAASGKPVFAYADELAASAAYALATVADRGIYLPESGIVGSIGTVSIHLERSKQLEQNGVTPTVVRSGSRKMEVNSIEPLTAEAKATIQERVDMFAGQFASLVADRRGGTPGKWLALEGRALTGAAAVSAGLADGVASFDQVLAMAAASAAEGQSMNAEAKLAALGIKVMASAEDIGAARAALDVGRAVIGLAGTSDADATLAKVSAWQGAATKVATFEAAEVARVAAEKASTEKVEAAERVELVRAMVKGGRVMPGKAWLANADGAFGPEHGLAEPWASMKLKSLRATAAAIEPDARLAAVSPVVAPLGALDEDAYAERAKKAGVSVESLRAADREFAKNHKPAAGAAIGS